MSMNTITKFTLLRHPVPTAFGIPGMRAVVLHGTGKDPDPDTVYVAYTESERVLIAVIFDHNGLAQVEKTYCKKGKFDIEAMLKGRRGKGPFSMDKKAFEALFAMRIVQGLSSK